MLILQEGCCYDIILLNAFDIVIRPFEQMSYHFDESRSVQISVGNIIQLQDYSSWWFCNNNSNTIGFMLWFYVDFIINSQ